MIPKKIGNLYGINQKLRVQVYAIGAIVGHSLYDFKKVFYNDSLKTQDEVGKQACSPISLLSYRLYVNYHALPEMVNE